VPKKPLIETNPDLRNADGRSKALITNVTIARMLRRAERTSPVKARQRSGR
jgi:hypothetical protein